MNKTSNEKVNYEETKFYGLLKIVKLDPIKNWSIVWAFLLVASMVLYTVCYERFLDVSKVAILTTSTLLSASAAIFGIVIAALTLTITLFHQKLLPIMLERKLLHKYLFPFWFAVSLWGMNVFLFLGLMFLQVLANALVIAIVFSVAVFLFLFATFYTVSLTGLVVQLALQRAQVE